MLSSSIRSFKDSNNDNRSILVTNQGRPFFWPNIFVTSDYFCTGMSDKTIKKVLRTISMLYTWGDQCSINIDKELINGNFLSIDVVEDLVFYLRLSARSQKSFKATKPCQVMNLSQNQIRNISKSRNSEFTFTSATETATRIRWIIKYLDYHLTRRSTKITKNSIQQMNLLEHGKLILNRLKELIPRSQHGKYDEKILEGLSEAEQDICTLAFNPQSENNPFSNKYIKLRNQLIFKIFIDTGMRREELNELKIEDIDRFTGDVQIQVSKTFPRTVRISEETAILFRDFISFKSKISNNGKENPYLFVSKKGKKISLNTINLIFTTFRKNVNGVPNDFTPHTLRRTWNDNFSRLIDNIPKEERYSVEEEMMIRNRLMGWTINSNMAQRYAKRHIRKKADDLNEQIVNNLI